MSRALLHRGPDEEGFLEQPGVALASRRLSIVGLADGQQPVANEDRSVSVVFNGELFDHLERRAELAARGHRLVTHCDTEIIPHMWEEYQEGMWEKLRGQFAIALWDDRKRQLHLGRDRFGIAPLYWSRQGDLLLFASEIKGLLASGLVPMRPDRRGIDHVFSFSALPGPRTCFEGVQLLPPGHFLSVTPADDGNASAVITERAYWEMNFPDEGEEVQGDPKTLVDNFEKLLVQAVEERLRADVPVGAYLSGGVDSSMIVALACRLKGPAINTYTVRVHAPELDELDAASLSARHIGTKPPIVQDFRHEDALETYPRLISAAEAPVIDTACAALLQLAGKVHSCGQKVVLTGEGADEWLVGYPWYKAAKLLGYLDIMPGLPLSNLARRAYLRLRKVPHFPNAWRQEVETSVGGPERLDRLLRIAGHLEAPFFSESMREGAREYESVVGIGFPARTRPALASACTAASGSLRASCSPVTCFRPRATAWRCTLR
jgi:asparagine synthase (glutamine-hydrolysing)